MKKDNWKEQFKLNSENVDQNEVKENVSSRSAKMLVL